MEPPRHNWFRRLKCIPRAALFVDSRIVHAPPPLLQQLIEDYNARNGLSNPPGALSSSQIRLRDELLLLWKGQPRMVHSSIEERNAGSSRLRLQFGYGPRAELLLSVASITLWVAVWLAFAWLISIRNDLLPGGRLGQFGPAFPVIVLAGCWLGFFTWIWVIAFRPHRSTDQFYHYLTRECGISHITDKPLRFAWSSMAQVAILSVGLLGLCLELSTMLSVRDRTLFLGVVAFMYSVVALVALTDRSSIRWMTGKAAYAVTMALNLYLLFPLILWAVESTNLREHPFTLHQDQGGGRLYAYCFAPILGLVAMLLVLVKITRQAPAYARAIDYWRSHPESERWAAPKTARITLLLLIIMVSLFAGGLFWLAFKHSAMHCMVQLFGQSPWGTSVAFESAALFIGTIGSTFLAEVGIPIVPDVLGGLLLFLFALPVLAWGFCHLIEFLIDVLNYVRLCGLARPALSDELRAALVQLRRAARILPPLIRVQETPGVFACAVLSPMPLLPHVVLLSRGALKSLPIPSLIAVLAHETGHLRHGHTQLLSLLRLMSRVLLLGPGFLTALIKSPIELEAQADAFAVRWLESVGRTRQDLIDALQFMEREQVLSMLPRHSTSAVGVARTDHGDWLPRSLRRMMAGDQGDFWINRALSRWRLYHHLVFRSDLAIYPYAPLFDRLKFISALPRRSSTA